MTKFTRIKESEFKPFDKNNNETFDLYWDSYLILDELESSEDIEDRRDYIIDTLLENEHIKQVDQVLLLQCVSEETLTESTITIDIEFKEEIRTYDD